MLFEVGFRAGDASMAIVELVDRPRSLTQSDPRLEASVVASVSIIERALGALFSFQERFEESSRMSW